MRKPVTRSSLRRKAHRSRATPGFSGALAVGLLGLLLFAFAAGAHSEGGFDISGLSPQQAGEALFREMERRESGYQDLVVDLEMVLYDTRGGESHRELKIQQLEMQETGDRLLVIFDSPKSIRGTALLSYSYKFDPDDQWLFLPAMKRVKKIASKNRSGPFLSSEFAFEDLALQEVEKFSYRLLEQGSDAEGDFYLVERTPVDKYSGYSQQIVRLDAPELRIRFIEFSDRRGRALKTLLVDDYALYLDRFWKPGLMVMTNLQTGKITELFWRNYRFGVGLEADRDFSTNALRRIR
jgi:hypothetical protein